MRRQLFFEDHFHRALDDPTQNLRVIEQRRSHQSDLARTIRHGHQLLPDTGSTYPLS